jgi:23S rRNA pseudouridine1911/1915/1917 synthase
MGMNSNGREPLCFPESRILHEDPGCLVINKLPGEAMEGAAPGMVNLPRLLGERYGPSAPEGNGGTPFLPAAVNRLDVPVSGCALFARTPRALSRLNGALAKGNTEKYYWAVVELPADPRGFKESGELTHWIHFDKKHNKSIAFREPEKDRKKGTLRYRLLGRGTRYLFLEIALLTGRHHQIRAQLAAEGLHIKGDLKYGARRSEKTGGIRLHARSLIFPDPSGPGIIRVEALPPLRDRLWDALAGSAGVETPGGIRGDASLDRP